MGAMISTHEIMPMFLEVCPAFEPRWKAHLEWWNDDDRGVYNDTGEFARYLIECLARGDIEELRRAFDVTERIIRDGDQGARDVAIIGVIESVQVQSSHHSFGSAPFVEFLGPLGREAWCEIETLWDAGGGSLAGVLRFESSLQEPRKRWWMFWK